MLTVSQLTFGYFKEPIIRDLSFTVEAGELWHVKGPNGTGKSTLLSLLSGLLQPDTGEITFADGITKEYLPAERNGHYLKLDARENLKFWLSLHDVQLNESDLREELAFWNLSPVILANRVQIEQFSTGMKRKLALARVKLSQTKLWLLDEPVSGLDDYALGKFTTMLQQHTAAGGAAMVVSHDTAPIKDITTGTLNIGE